VTAPAAPAQPPSQPANTFAGPATATGTGSVSGFGLEIFTRRNLELVLLLFVFVLLTVYTAAVEAAAVEKITADFWVPVAALAIVFLLAHVAIRFLAQYADPVILPCVALINGLGVLYLRRIDLGKVKTPAARENLPPFSGDSGRQLIWTVIALVIAMIVLAVVRDHRTLSLYAYTLGLVGIVLVLIPAVLPSAYSEVNGAKLWIRFGSLLSIQPGEFAKIMLLVFFAYYLVRKRDLLLGGGRRILGLDFPRGRDLGPVLTVWLLSLMVLVFEKDLGTSLLYFGMFVVTVYVATERVSWLIIGVLLFIGGAFSAYFLGAAFGGPFANFKLRADIWLDPFQDPTNRGYQLVQSLLGLGTGGLFGAGPGSGQFTSIPEVRTDFIFAGMGEEIGLFGLTSLLVVYLLIVERGLRAALGVRDSFGKLFAGGLSFTLGLQIFVIVGGISRLIPLTGQTTPFLSAGGSSLMANWILIALLLRVSDAARHPTSASASAGRADGRGAQPARLHDAPTEMIR
jgi:cell division protein FtsW (lipid II flippase)